MSIVVNEKELPEAAGASSDKDVLLRQAARQMLVMRNVIKLAVKQLRQEKHLSDKSEHLGEGQYHALHVLCEDGPMMVGDLAQQCHVADPTISKMLNGLVDGGWVDRQNDPKNRRAVLVSATPSGRELYARLQEHFERGLALVLSPLSSAQLEDLIAAFGHLENLVGDRILPQEITN